MTPLLSRVNKIWRFLKNLELPYDPALSPVGIFPKAMKRDLEELSTTHVHRSNIHNSHNTETT